MYGGVRTWDPGAHAWRDATAVGGTQDTMRVGRGLLEFGDSTVKYDGRTILGGPRQGGYQLFFYANGHLCFYHVNRGEGGYRPYQNDEDGFSKLHACPWTPEEPEVDLSKAVVLTLPVVGETTFAWGQFGRQIVTGSNIGGFYVLEEGRWRRLREPNLKVSYQLYSTMAFYNRLLMGQLYGAEFAGIPGGSAGRAPGIGARILGNSVNRARGAQLQRLPVAMLPLAPLVQQVFPVRLYALGARPSPIRRCSHL